MKKPPKAKPTKLAGVKIKPTEPDAPVVTTTVAPKVYVLRYWADADRFLERECAIILEEPHRELLARLKVGDRLFLQAWGNGEPTGRARLVVVTSLRQYFTADIHVRVGIQQSWAWSRGATTESPTALSLVCEKDVFPVYTVLIDKMNAPCEAFYGLELQVKGDHHEALASENSGHEKVSTSDTTNQERVEAPAAS